MTEPQVEPRRAVECPGDEPFILGEQPVSIPAALLFRDDPGHEPPPRHVAPSPAKSTEWPSAKDILAVHQAAARARSRQTQARRRRRRSSRSTLMPTLEARTVLLDSTHRAGCSCCSHLRACGRIPRLHSLLVVGSRFLYGSDRDQSALDQRSGGPAHSAARLSPTSSRSLVHFHPCAPR